jgi:pilus assembly protein Flp/PilA
MGDKLKNHQNITHELSPIAKKCRVTYTIMEQARKVRVITPRREVSVMLYAPKEKGQGLVEYALILVLVAVVVIVILALLGPAIGNVFSNIVNNI